MLTTLELRWFFHGTLPPEVERWFNTDCPGKLLGESEEREDFYLYVPECDYLNIKLRQGSLEVKWRKTQLGVLRFGESWEGNVEKWLKWSCQERTQQSLIPADIVGERAWIGVKKKRSQRQYQGISYEITQLEVKGDRWWTIAFEMAVIEANQFDNFENALNQVSKSDRGLELQAKMSFAYPTWLSLLA